MKLTALFLSLTALFWAILVIAVPTWPADSSGLKNFYEKCIMAEIESCNTKAEIYKNSKSANLRKMASLDAIKKEYLSDNKNRIIAQLIKSNVGKKDYKVHILLEELFYSDVVLKH